MNDVKVLMTHPAHMFISDGLWIGGEGHFARRANKDQKVGLEDGGFRRM